MTRLNSWRLAMITQRWTLLLLPAAMIAVLTGCGGSTYNVQNPPPPPPTPMTVTVQTSGLTAGSVPVSAAATLTATLTGTACSSRRRSDLEFGLPALRPRRQHPVRHNLHKHKPELRQYDSQHCQLRKPAHRQLHPNLHRARNHFGQQLDRGSCGLRCGARDGEQHLPDYDHHF